MYKSQPENQISKQGYPPSPELPPEKPGVQLRRGGLQQEHGAVFVGTLQQLLALRGEAQRVYPCIPTFSPASDHTGTEPPCVFSSSLLLMILQIASKPVWSACPFFQLLKNQLGSQNIPCLGSPATSPGSLGNKQKKTPKHKTKKTKTSI